MNNVLLSYFCNTKNTQGIRVFVNSIQKLLDKSFDLVLFDASDDLDEDLYEFIKSIDIKVLRHKRQIDCLFVDRFLAYNNFIYECDYNYVMMTDLTDIYFQRDPFLDLDKSIGLYLCSENILVKDAPWNFEIVKNLYGYDSAVKILDEIVINSGTIAGSKQDVANLCDNIISYYANKPPFIGSDQGVLMKIIYDSSCKIQYKFAPHYFCLVMSPFFNYPDKLILKNGINFKCGTNIEDNNGKKYAIVHQYNRNFEWNERILNKYGKS
jgi:hypothetical protein